MCTWFNGESQIFGAGNKKANVSFHSVYLPCTELTAIIYNFYRDFFQITKIIVVSCALKVKRICLEVFARFSISVFKKIEKPVQQ